jgi:hypothetical protein
MSRRFVSFLLMSAFAFGPALRSEARDRPIELVGVDRAKLVAYNVGLTSLFTLVSAIAQREVHSWRDAARCFLIGSGAGYSFYQAKRIAGQGRTTEGWILANLTTSVVENTSSGEHPFGTVGATAGPVRLRVATPFGRKAVARFELDASIAETVFLVQALREGDDVRVRDGLIAVDRDTPWPDPDRDGYTFSGRTYGVFAGISPEAEATTWRHEVVHAIQNQQMDSVEPSLYTRDRNRTAHRRLFVFRHVRGGSLHLANVSTYQRPYAERWGEVEAYALAERTRVP